MNPTVFESAELHGQHGIVLTPINGSHAPGCFAACQDEEIHRWLPLPQPYTLEIASAWCAEGADKFRASGLGIHYAITIGGSFAGCISYKNVRWGEGIVEVGYWIAPEFRGMGLATQSVEMLSRNAFALGFDRVELRIADGNKRSAAVAVRCGYRKEGVLRSAGVVHGGRVDLVLYSQIMSDVIIAQVARSTEDRLNLRR
ncbi:GNAT family N-acetyltransferase [Arthrobacter tecti]